MLKALCGKLGHHIHHVKHREQINNHRYPLAPEFQFAMRKPYFFHSTNSKSNHNRILGEESKQQNYHSSLLNVYIHANAIITNKAKFSRDLPWEGANCLHTSFILSSMIKIGFNVSSPCAQMSETQYGGRVINLHISNNIGDTDT